MSMMKALLLGGGVAVVAGVTVYMVKNREDSTPMGKALPPPGECVTTAEVWQGTMGVINDPKSDAKALRHAADVLKGVQVFCDVAAKSAAHAAITMLETRADEVDKGAGPLPPPPPPILPNPGAGVPGVGVGVPPLPITMPIPGGQYYAGYGWCPPGAVLNMKSGLCEFDQSYSMPGMGTVITSGCCPSCQNGGECTGCG